MEAKGAAPSNDYMLKILALIEKGYVYMHTKRDPEHIILYIFIDGECLGEFKQVEKDDAIIAKLFRMRRDGFLLLDAKDNKLDFYPNIEKML